MPSIKCKKHIGGSQKRIAGSERKISGSEQSSDPDPLTRNNQQALFLHWRGGKEPPYSMIHQENEIIGSAVFWSSRSSQKSVEKSMKDHGSSASKALEQEVYFSSKTPPVNHNTGSQFVQK